MSASAFDHSFDVAIIGAGPAGSAAAIALNGSGLRCAIIDKSVFPRDKICGDAISPDVVSQLQKLPLHTGKLFNDLQEKIWSSAVRFISPDFSFADISLRQRSITGYVCPRMVFDQMMFECARRASHVTALTGNSVRHIERVEDGFRILLDNQTNIHTRLIVGADGANSVVGRQLHKSEMDKYHHCAGLRQYWENVSGFSDQNAVELHFYKELLPGYFWMFPLPGNRANIGIGMLSAHVQKRRINLKSLMNEIIAKHPNVRHRFADARPLEEIKGFGLPLGSKKRKLSGDGYLLVGDAASLINPLSGEGIANAVRSGRVAAEHVCKVFGQNRFDAKFNALYDAEIYRRLWSELQLNYWIQLAMRRPALCNFIVKRAIGNPMVQDLVMSGFNADKIKLKLLNPFFFTKVFTQTRIK